MSGGRNRREPRPARFASLVEPVEEFGERPETAMHEDHFTPAGKNQVWLSGQVWTVKSVAAAHGVSKVAERPEAANPGPTDCAAS